MSRVLLVFLVPGLVIAVGAVAGMVVTALGMVLFSDEPARLEVSAVGFIACLVALVVVPMRVRLPLAASEGRRRELAVAPVGRSFGRARSPWRRRSRA